MADLNHTSSKEAENPENLQTLFDVIDDFVFILDARGSIIHINRVVEDRLGYSRNELIEMHVTDVHSPERRAEAAAVVADMLAGKTNVCKVPLVTREGEQIPVETKVTRGRWSGQNVLFGIAHDISQRQRIEETQHVLIDAVQDSLFLMETDGTILVANQRVAQRFGMTVEEIVGSNAYDLLPAAIAEQRRQIAEQVISNGKPETFEDRRLDRDIENRLYPVRDEQGSVTQLAILGRDVTESIKAQQALARERDLLNRVMQTSPTAMVTIDLAGQITFANRRAEEILGLSKEEITQRTYDSPTWRITDFDGNPLSSRALAFRRVVETGQPVYGAQHTIEWPNGRQVLLSINASPFFDANGEIEGVIAAIEDITERKEAEQALRESLQTSADIVRSIPAGLFIYQYQPPDRLYLLDGNPEAEKLTGILVEDWLGKEFNEIWPEARAKGVTDAYLGVIQTGETFEVEDLHYTDDRLDGAFRIRAFLMPSDRLGVAFENITKRKQAEQELQEQMAYEKLSATISNLLLDWADSPDNAELGQVLQLLLDYLDADIGSLLQIEEDGEKVQTILRWGRERGKLPHLSQEALPWYIDQVLHNDFLGSVTKNLPDEATSEIEIARQEGVQSNLAIRLTAQGRVVGGLAFSCLRRDYEWWTEQLIQRLQTIGGTIATALLQKQAQEALQQRNRELRALLEIALAVGSSLDLDAILHALLTHLATLVPYESASIALVEDGQYRFLAARGFTPDFDLDTIERELNEKDKWRAFFYRKEPVVYQDVRQVEEWIDVPQSPTNIRSWMGVPLLHRGKILGTLNIDHSKASFFTPEHARLAVAVAHQAATAIQNAQLFSALEQRVAERTRQLTAANAELEALSRVKDEFVANVSHELRTPITNLLVRHYLLKHRPNQLEKHLPVMERETRRLKRIIEDLLQLSRMDQGHTETTFEAVDLNHLAREFVTDRTLPAAEKGLTLSLLLHNHLPPVYADPGLLGQVLSILLTNAISYTPAGGQVTIRTLLDANKPPEWIGFGVSDTGPGISPGEQPRLFERFFRGEAGNASQTPGTGLGLALAKEIVERYKGQIQVQSEGVSGQGTTFTVWLPLPRGARSTPTTSPPCPPPPPYSE